MCFTCPGIHSSPHFLRSLQRLPAQFLPANETISMMNLLQAQEEWADALKMVSLGYLEFQHLEELWPSLIPDWNVTQQRNGKIPSKMPHPQQSISPFLCLWRSNLIIRCSSLFELVSKKQKIPCKAAQEEKKETMQRWGELRSGSWCLRDENNLV